MIKFNGYFTNTRRLELAKQLAEVKEVYTAQGEQRERRSTVVKTGEHYRVGHRLQNGDNHYQYIDAITGAVWGDDSFGTLTLYADSNIIKECHKWGIEATDKEEEEIDFDDFDDDDWDLVDDYDND